MRTARLVSVAVLAAAALSAQNAQPDPTVRKMLAEVSPDRIGASVKTLAGFGTRSNYSDQAIAAARAWIASQFKSYSPRLDVSLDSGKTGAAEVVNVVAVLRGTTQPDQKIVVGAHYDSTNRRAPRGPAPGADDNASGTAVVLELARVMSQYRFQKTIVFIAFGGEEIGLVGSSRYASRAQAAHEQIEAVFNNDIVGSNTTGSTHPDLDGVDNDIVPEDSDTSNMLRVYSPDPVDSASRKLARTVQQIAGRYVPGIRIDLVSRADRFGRNGDQTPFQKAGYPAVRFTSASENTDVQHTAEDTPDGVSPLFAAEVARVNGAVIATLAAPSR